MSHYSDKCPDKDKIAKDDWACKKGIQMYCKKTENNKSENENKEEHEEITWQDLS